jgi:peptide/nickel transport system permease protein
MLRYLIKKTIYSFAILLGVIVIIFFLFERFPDPARAMAGKRVDKETLINIRKSLGLDQPMHIRLVSYLNDLSPIAVHENSEENEEKYSYAMSLDIGKNVLVLKAPYFRTSYQRRTEVSEIIYNAVPSTAILALTSIIIALIIGLILGIVSAVYKDTFWDRIALVFATAGISTPSFVSGPILAFIFAYLLYDWTGLNVQGELFEETIDDNLNTVSYVNLKNLILPAITLGIRPVSIIMLLTRSSLLDALSQDYVRTAFAKGLKTSVVLFKHSLRNALNPVVTAVSGWFASLLAGAFFVESVFNLKGIGFETIMGIEQNDKPVVMGCVVFIAIIFVLTNFFVDILYSVLDPRVSLKSSK